jgi:YaiO family outer membrane protein
MNKKSFIRMFLLPALALPLWLGAAERQDDPRERAAAAVRAGDYEGAIQLCLEGLRQNHADYELNFLLGRAYAYSGRYDEALRVFSDLALAHPENADVLLLRARVNAWSHAYKEAESGYREVLRLDPGNSEALIGLAEISSWQGDLAAALALYGKVREKEPDNADIHFRIGRIYLWQGSRGKAEENFKMALRIDPQNKEYKRALQKTKPRLQEKFELRYEYQRDDFGDGRSRYLDQNIALQMSPFKDTGPLVLKFNHADRPGGQDRRYGLEFYPRLWKKAYGYLDAAYSPQGLYYPETAYLFEAYQAVFSSAEISLGFRRMNYAAQGITQLLGSLGYYWGNFYAYWRWYYSAESSGSSFAWLANVRRYFSADSYIFIAGGQGVRTEDVVTWEDYRVDQSWVLLGGFNWYLLGRIKLNAYFSIGKEGDVRRGSLFLSTGYRF